MDGSGADEQDRNSDPNHTTPERRCSHSVNPSEARVIDATEVPFISARDPDPAAGASERHLDCIAAIDRRNHQHAHPMITTRTLLWVLALVLSALRATAAEHTETSQSFDSNGPAPWTGPLTRATMLEAARLATEGDAVSTAAGGGTARASDWSRVRQLAPGTKIVVTVKNAWTATCRFVAAEDSELVVRVAAGRVEHLARADVAQIKVEHSKVLYGTLMVGLGLALMPVGAAVGYKIADGGGQVPVGALLGAIIVPIGTVFAIRALYPPVKVIY
jgi:hypothetical protein